MIQDKIRQEERKKRFYLCNGKKCMNCSMYQDMCYHTSDFKYALYQDKTVREWERVGDAYFERGGKRYAKHENTHTPDEVRNAG